MGEARRRPRRPRHPNFRAGHPAHRDAQPEHADAALARHSSLADNALNSLHAGRVLKDELVSGMEAVMGPVAVEAGT